MHTFYMSEKVTDSKLLFKKQRNSLNQTLYGIITDTGVELHQITYMYIYKTNEPIHVWLTK